LGTAANEADITRSAALLHGQEEAAFGDAGYSGADKRPELADRDVSWNIAVKRSTIVMQGAAGLNAAKIATIALHIAPWAYCALADT
jgi:IS5 family transposase